MKVTHTWRADGDRIVDERWICDDHDLDLICPADAAPKLAAIEQIARKHDMADIIAVLEGP